MMANYLTNRPKIEGISKKKVFAFVLLVIVLLIVVLTKSFDDDSKPSAISADDGVLTNTNTNDDASQVLAAAQVARSKNAVVMGRESLTITSSAVITNSQNAPDIVIPPIVANGVKTQMPLASINNSDDSTADNYDKNSYQHKKQINKYSSYTAKTLMFSQPLTNVDTNQVDNFAPKVSASSGENRSLPMQAKQSSLQSMSGVIGGNTNQDISMTSPNAKFLDNGQSADYADSGIHYPKSKYELKAGSVIPAIMINGLNSDLPGEIIAQVRENIYDSVSRRYLLIPQGARLIGLYDSHIAYGQERVLVIWNRLIYPDGSFVNLHAMPGTDMEGYAGFHDIVDRKYWQIFGTSFILGVITGAMQYSQNNTNPNVQVGGFGYSSNPTIGQTLAGSLGQQLGQTGLSIAEKNLNVAPTLIIRPNYPFTVMLTADLVLKPYAIIGSSDN